MNPSRFLPAMLLCVAMVCLPAAAATYYVAQQDPKAADTNAGAEAAPFKTINAAIKGLKPGDTLLIKGGTYRGENIRLDDSSGISGKSFTEMITISAAPGEHPVIKGSQVITGWTLHKDKIWYTENAPKPEELPILFCDEKRMDLIGDYGGEMMRIIKARAGFDVWKGKKDGTLENLAANTYFYDKDAKRLYIWLADGGDPNKRLMEMTIPSGSYVGTSYVKVSGLKFLQSSMGIGGSCNMAAIRAWAAPGAGTASSTARPPITTSSRSTPAGIPAVASSSRCAADGSFPATRPRATSNAPASGSTGAIPTSSSRTACWTTTAARS
jgi:hypothetical protein